MVSKLTDIDLLLDLWEKKTTSLNLIKNRMLKFLVISYATTLQNTVFIQIYIALLMEMKSKITLKLTKLWLCL